MAIFNKGSDLVFPPKVGERTTVLVTAMRKVEQTEFPERNLKSSVAKGSKNFGYYYALTLEDGKEMPINTWSLYFAFQESGVDFGDTIEIYHEGAGKYVVTKVEGSKPIGIPEEIWQE